MNKPMRWTLGIAAVVVFGAGLVLSGIFFGRMAGPWGNGPNMMGYTANGAQTTMTRAPARSAGVGNSAAGMLGSAYGMMNGGMLMGGSTMMGGTASLYGVQPLSIAAAQSAAEAYLAGLRNSDLAVGEVIIFDNQAYARIDEKSTGHAAFEVLVDPVTLAVSPEPGANMMWNLKYGMMNGAGASMMGGTGGMTHAPARSAGVGGYAGGATAANPNDPMPVTVAQAVETAQRYLDTYLPGAKAETTADTFYGYYTLEILRNGQMVSMLSVNGYSRQVILHTWHGKFIETSAK
jgi:hypothetical protein